MAAAVADYRPRTRHPSKMKKDGQIPEPIHLVENPDILAALASQRSVAGMDAAEQAAAASAAPGDAAERESGAHAVQVGHVTRPGKRPGGNAVLVGFAAETDTSAQAARAKLARKGCDLLVVNPVGGGLGFGTGDNEAVVYGSDGSATEIPRGPKEILADVVWDLVASRLR
jgi:phosphopantothenoylcysteine decarboxylase/phosphopantothenate--cysteine ligase